MIGRDEVAVVPSRNARVVAVICELWCWLGPFFLVAIVVRATSARSDPFLRAITAEVLDLQLVALPLLVAGAACAPLGWTLPFLLIWTAWLAVVFYGYVVGVIGAVHAWKGRCWRYPINLRVLSS